MTSINDVRHELAAAVASIDGLVAYATVPDQPNPPCAIVAFAGRDPRNAAAAGATEYRFSVTVLAPRTAVEQSQELLDDYATPTGSLSVQAALEACDVYGVGAVTVTSVGPETAVIVDPLTFVGVEFGVSVVVT